MCVSPRHVAAIVQHADGQGQPYPITCPVAGQGGALAIAHAPPLAKHGHKVPLTSAAVARALLRLVR